MIMTEGKQRPPGAKLTKKLLDRTMNSIVWQWDTVWQSDGKSTLYDFTNSNHTATKSRQPSYIYTVRADTPMRKDGQYKFAFHIDRYSGNNIDVGFGGNCGVRGVR